MNIKKISIIAVVLIIIAAAVYSLLPSSVSPITWQNGARQMYRLDIRTIMSGSYPSMKSLNRAFELRGILNFRIYGIDGNRIRAGFQLSNLAIKRGIMEDKAAEKIYSGLFFADFSRDGGLLEFKFSNEISAEDERIMSDIIQSFQLVVKDSIFDKWSVEEKNINGAYKAQYSAEEGRISKIKKKYTAVTDTAGNTPGERIEIKKSGMQFAYGSHGSWISSAEGNDLMVFYSGDNPYLKVSSTFKLSAVDYNPDKSLAIWGGGKSSEDMIAEWGSLPKNQLSLDKKSEADALRDKFGNKTLQNVAGELFKKYRAFDVKCIQELLEYLELHPEAALQFPDYLRDKKLNPVQQVMFIHALERNGSENSQKAISEIMLGSEFSGESRTQAAVAFGSISEPTQESIKSLWDAYETSYRKGDTNAYKISSTAVLALGSMAKNLENSENEEYSGLSKSIKHRISADLETKKDLNTTVALLHAAGNTADEDMLEDISPYFEDNNPRVRSVAISSLTNMDDSKVYDILTEKLDSENDINVRETIVNIMYRKEPTEETIKSVIDKIPSEENDIVRGSMYRYLMKNREMPGVKDALSEMLKAETSAEHRKIISRALYSKKPGAGSTQ